MCDWISVIWYPWKHRLQFHGIASESVKEKDEFSDSDNFSTEEKQTDEVSDGSYNDSEDDDSNGGLNLIDKFSDKIDVNCFLNISNINLFWLYSRWRWSGCEIY